MPGCAEDQIQMASNIQERAGPANWTDWKWHMRNSLRDVDTFENLLGVTLSPEFKARAQETIARFPMSVTPYYFSLIDPDDYQNDPIFKQCFPSHRELELDDVDLDDPLAEEDDSPAPGLTHRYPDRVLFHGSNTGAMYCRHCTRKRKVGDNEFIPRREQLQKGIDYIRRTPAVRDVLLSGGDPFLLPDEQIDWLLAEISAIPHVEVVRLGTRTPVVLPFRITDNLLSILRKHRPLWLNTHFNHPREMTAEAAAALAKLADAGIPLGNQTVLLAGVNDCPRIMRTLVHKLVRNRVRPYYIYQCDLSEGLAHFRTPVGKGIEIIESLIGHTSRFAVPRYVIDTPGGGGKIPVMPEYLISRSADKVILRNYEGVITSYPEPKNYVDDSCNDDCPNCPRNLKCDVTEHKAVGIEKLLYSRDTGLSLTPEHTERLQRRREIAQDRLGNVGHSLVHHGSQSDRGYLLKLHPKDGPTIAKRLERLAQQNGYTKLLAKVAASDAEYFPGWILEARIPGFYNLEKDGVFLAKYLAVWRKDPEDPEQIREIVALARKKAGEPAANSCLPEGYSIVRLGKEHAEAMGELYGQVFSSYPFPILDPEFIRECMDRNVHYLGVLDGEGRLVAVAAADVGEQAGHVERTECATRKELRNMGLAGLLLGRMDADMRELGLKVAYTICRAASTGINVNFARSGYLFAGTLVNNTHISGGLSSMNIWYKAL